MSILKVARLGNPVLCQVARLVPDPRIASPEIQRLIDDMVETMREYDGVGLAAVQVHETLQIAVIEAANNPRYPEKPRVPLSVLINPQITSLSEPLEHDWEGCLSISELRGRVPRYRKIRVLARDREGTQLDFVAEGFHARIIQHEWDHLQGKVFMERMSDLSTLTHLQEYYRYHQKDKSN